MAEPGQKPADFWRVAGDELAHPDCCRIFIDMMHRSYQEVIKRNRQSVPFMDLVEVGGLKLTGIDVEVVTPGHCRLLTQFIDILATSKAFLIGQYNTRSAKIIVSCIRSIMGSDLANDFLEGVLNAVLELDPGLMSMLMVDLWPYWVRGELIDIMAKLCTYLGRKNSPASIMKHLYGQGKSLTKKTTFNSGVLIAPFESLLQPLLGAAKIDFIGQLILDLNINLTEGDATTKQLVIDVLYTAIRVALDSIQLETAQLSDADDERLNEQLDQVSQLLAKNPTGLPFACLASWWRLEAQKRLFGAKPDDQFMTGAIRQQLDLTSMTEQQQFTIELERAYWASVTGTDIDTVAKRFCQYLGRVGPDVEMSNREMLLEIAPDMYAVQPELMTAAVAWLLSIPRDPGLFNLQCRPDSIYM